MSHKLPVEKKARVSKGGRGKRVGDPKKNLISSTIGKKGEFRRRYLDRAKYDEKTEKISYYHATKGWRKRAA